MSHPYFRRAASLAALFLAALAYACLALAVYGISPQRFYSCAFFLLIAAFCAIELRIQMGSRVARTPLVYAHIVSATTFFIALGTLAFVTRPAWLVAVMSAFAGAALISGCIIFTRPAPTYG